MKFNNKNKIFSSISVLLLFLSIIVLKANAQHNNNHGENHNQEQSENHHSHKTLDISDESKIPTIKIEVIPDKIKGWNLEIKTNNFIFNPETVNQNSNIHNGHAHLYINEEKITRIYCNWYYIAELPKRDNKIKVTLNTNLHQELIYKGNIIGDQVNISNAKILPQK